MTIENSSIVRLLTRPRDRYLRGTIFEKIYKSNSSVHDAVNLHPQQFDGYTTMPSGAHFRKPVDIILAIHKVWQRLLHSVTNPKHAQLAPDEAERRLLNYMCYCLPAGVIWHPAPEQRTCKKFTVCPWCRYRLGLRITERVESQVPNYRWIAKATLLIPTPQKPESFVYFPNEMGINRLLKVLLNKRRCWDAGVTVTLPEYGRRSHDWNLRVVIVALFNDRTRLVPLETLMQIWKWQHPPPVGSTIWEVKRSRVTAAREFVADAVSYSPEHLRTFSRVEEGSHIVKEPTTADELLQMANLSKYFRTRFHCMPPVRSPTPE